MNNVSRIVFTSCTGFGTQGRAASLYDAQGDLISWGCDSTDESAVLDALRDVTDEASALDLYAIVLKTAKIERNGI